MYECVCSVHVSHIYNAHNNTNTVTLIIFGRAYSNYQGAWMDVTPNEFYKFPAHALTSSRPIHVDLIHLLVSHLKCYHLNL